MEKYPEKDDEWTESHWRSFIQQLISLGLFDWEEVAGSVLSRLNTPQVGTSMTNARFQRNHGKGKTWSAVRDWLYKQQGVCVDCGTRLELQADHIRPKQDFIEKGEDPVDADYTAISRLGVEGVMSSKTITHSRRADTSDCCLCPNVAFTNK